MDIHHSSSFDDLDRWSKYRFINTTLTDTAAIVPGIWACRRLQSLHINLHGHEEYGLRYPVHSRIIFGYISLVCPLLEDLQLTVSSECRRRDPKNGTSATYFTNLCMRLEGGLCLLPAQVFDHFWVGRLLDFQELGCWPVDLNWIIAEGNRPLNREKRRNDIAQWDDKLQIEEQLETERLLTGAKFAKVLMLENGDYVSDVVGELADQLKNLGLLSEIKAMVEEMDQDGYRCFPVLDRVSFSRAITQRPVDALTYLFPNGKPR